MAPKVNVPMDFGRHLIGSPTHSNLKLNTSEGGEVRASSVILSFNSPVIDHMTTTLHMTSVDMLEFSKPAVQLFVDACYSGTAEGITRDIFRDINKMANVFEVSWLADKCAGYFKEVADSVKTPSYTELLYLFEEASFVFENLKTKDYLNITFEKIAMLRWKQEFIERYLENAERLTTQKLDMVMELAGSEVNCIVQTLTNQLAEMLKVQGPNLPVSSEYLLNNCCLYFCKKSDRVLFDRLFDVLGGLPDERMRWTFELHRKSLIKRDHNAAEASGSSLTMSSCNKIPNLYHDLNFDMTFNQLLDWISVSEKVTSLLMAIEAFQIWEFNRRYIKTPIMHISLSDEQKLHRRLSEIVEQRGWLHLPPDFKKTILISRFEISSLCTQNNYKDTKGSLTVIDAIDPCDHKPLSFLSKDAKIVYRFKHPSVLSCNLPGCCGFILKTVPSKGSLWTLKLCTEKEEYLNEPVHYHSEVRAEDMHVFVVNCNQAIFPFSWLNFLCLRDSASTRDFWEKKFHFKGRNKFKVMYRL